jgi:hypothetical protein
MKVRCHGVPDRVPERLLRLFQQRFGVLRQVPGVDEQTALLALQDQAAGGK